MLEHLLESQTPIFFLILITWMLIYKDRAFFSKMRTDFYIMLSLSLVLSLTNSVLVYTGLPIHDLALLEQLARMVLRPLILMIWLGIVLRKNDSKAVRFGLLPLPCLINAVLCALSIWNGLVFSITDDGMWEGGTLYLLPQFVYVFYLIWIVICSIRYARKNDTMEHIIIAAIAIVIMVAANLEFTFDSMGMMDSVVTVGICIYYFYLITQVYKLDALTKIMNRHNLMYDLEELINKEYLITMIDIDNFKSINDKYGHEKGDEALKQVVRVIKKKIDKKSKVYRYGGDEFTIITRGRSVGDLEALFESINDELETMDYRISYGIHEHHAGEGIMAAIKAADEYMYNNKKKLKSEGIWDDMTGLFNLRGFLDELETLKKQALQEGKDICLVGFDIEHLGNINLAYGYAEGNMIIAVLANIIKSGLDINEFVGHLGSDEFVAAMKIDKGETKHQEDLVAKVLASVRNAPEFDGKEYTLEINSAMHVVDVNTDASMENAVNEILYQKQVEKENRRKSPVSRGYDGQEIDKEEEAFALDIIENNKFKYAFQPIVSAKDGSVVAYEALMRTNTEPMMSPLTVLRHANNNHKNYMIEKLTYKNVLRTIADNKEQLEGKRIFINSIPGFILSDEDYADVRSQYGELLKNIVVEITEQSELVDEELAVLKNRQNDDLFGIAIDDYGSGNSNTFSLLRIKPEIIKLDRLLISDIDRNTKKQYFVNSIVTFAKENGMRVLAEGVETEAEMKMVIRLQVDYIQGFYTARPALNIVPEIPDDIRKSIVSENIRGVVEGKRKVYMASGGWETSLVQLALEEYTGITISTPDLLIVGNTDYVADMCIKIIDGLTCRLTLRNVRLSSVDDLPCISLGENVDLTLMIEGDCTLDMKGIYVPESSTLTIKGAGNLTVSTKGHDCYGIGCGREEAVGTLIFNQSGKLSVRVDGELCTAIGGGYYKTGNGIHIKSGRYDVSVASIEGIGIGCCYGEMPIVLEAFNMVMELRVNEGTGIGSRYSNQNIRISHSLIEIGGSGSRLAGIGTVERSGGNIYISEGTLNISMSGQDVCLLGVWSGFVAILTNNLNMKLKGEGNAVLGFGSMEKTADIHMLETDIYTVINAAIAIPIGTEDGTCEITGAKPEMHVNE